MAAVTKFSQSAIVNQLRHVERTIQHNANTDIDPDRFDMNYSLIDRGISSYSYYKDRLSQCYLYNRPDVKTMCGWVITLPKDVPVDKSHEFFKVCFDYCNYLYGEENCVQAIAHYDEGGQPHLHYDFLPVVKDNKHAQGIKVNCHDLLTPRHLRDWHPGLEKYLHNRGIDCKICTGVTARQGGAKTVEQLKAERNVKRERQVKQERTSIFWS